MRGLSLLPALDRLLRAICTGDPTRHPARIFRQLDTEITTCHFPLPLILEAAIVR